MSFAPILAQVVNLPPETPPLSERFIALLGFFTWIHLLATLAGVVCVCAQVAWQRGRRTPVGYLTVLLRAALAAAVVVAAGVLLESTIQ
ncbi:hypothetical protein OG874_13455 [Nocardia sp. NBC_00565]|uniref:hypothetical protein n=1 Tax=Nocardia sp. NBC_00565 TaxID=2975993 RepID=UPI002E820300|nr:hypothetical protein [Nocardia sp. NBC_00565]WUC06076.1 hypothetical protein OG874_13455 [Nocardia sp. NBC_00565]